MKPAKKMMVEKLENASPQCEDGFTKIANELMHALMKKYIPSNHMRCLLCVFRNIYGYKNKYYVKISLKDISELTGILRHHASFVMRDLVAHKMLNVTSTCNVLDKVVTSTCNVRAKVYEINKHYNQWIPFSGGKRKGKVVTSTCNVKVTSTCNTTPIYKNKKKTITQTLNLEFKKKVPVPDPFPIYDALKNYAQKKGFNGNLEDTHEAFLQYHKKHGTKYQDWYAAWQTWLRNAINPPWGKKDKNDVPTFEEEYQNQQRRI
jgi:phage replication O-like protein O